MAGAVGTAGGSGGRGSSPIFELKLKIKVICAVAARRCSFFSEKKNCQTDGPPGTASSDFSPARRSRHGQNPSSFPPLRTTLVEVVADAILVPMQIAPVCTRITTLGVCRRGRFAIGVLHLSLGRPQCNGDRPILVTAPWHATVAASVAAARRRRALPSPQDISTTSLLTILGVVAAHGPGARSRGPIFCGTSKIAISQPVVAGHSRSTRRPRRTRPLAPAASFSY